MSEDILRQQSEHNEYYKSTHIVVMVPIKVEYHEPTGVVYNFNQPTLEDIENAMRTTFPDHTINRSILGR